MISAREKLLNNKEKWKETQKELRSDRCITAGALKEKNNWKPTAEMVAQRDFYEMNGYVSFLGDMSGEPCDSAGAFYPT